MTTNHLHPRLPQAWSWKFPMDPHAGNYFPHQEAPKGEGPICEREHLFEKPLTPSDVGKLNRLVIPKQHAEKHFPLDGDSGEKGLLLSFEDESGKPWRFRYSYWTSSQSYVLTKGWSRFVKEKRLDAGDVVLFQRRRSSGDRLYIGWKRRGAVASMQDGGPAAAAEVCNAGVPWSPVYYAAPPSCPRSPSASYLYIGAVHQDCFLHAGEQTGVVEKTTPMRTTSSKKRLRLFGVNLDCGPDQMMPESPEPSSDLSSLTGSVRAQHQLQFFPGNGRPL